MATKRKIPATSPAQSSEAQAAPGKASAWQVRPLRVLISSRNNARIPRRGGGAVSLLEVRKGLQRKLQDETFCGQRLLEVWINEDSGNESGSDNIWDVCRREITDAHIVIAIYNGEAGWQRQRGGVGICHEEIKYALDHFPAKLYLIRLDYGSDPGLQLLSPKEAAAKPENAAFTKFLDDWKRWQGMAVDDAMLEEAVRQTVVKGISDLAINGSREGRKGRFYFGEPLDWSRLGYQERKKEIEKALVSRLRDLGSLDPLDPAQAREARSPGLIWNLDGERVLLSIHGVPSSFSIAEARELVGRPFLFDHASPAATGDGGLAGPVHLIACHKSCTESQIFSFLGHPDVYIVQAPFGFFAADRSSFVQTFFLTGCRDATATAMMLERMLEWITEADEGKALVARALSRQKILQAMRGEINRHAGETER